MPENTKYETATYRELKSILDGMDDAQLDAPIRWWGDERGGRVKAVEFLREDYVDDPAGEPGMVATVTDAIERLRDWGSTKEDAEAEARRSRVRAKKGEMVLLVDE